MRIGALVRFTSAAPAGGAPGQPEIFPLLYSMFLYSLLSPYW